ncbi:hypothetical protein LOC68_16900 [Blastopirellula sp. JC732]|uniref:Uncharacterized protein n=1 Tax=Blastopirellula sediminis TaxID=2894196 RepID=A0A9X1SH45_9BACT|nr:hypothetical protein [Blastopirellula sediminis]MCC9630073.1 hypothetical protein [Blastopirellula sediminis]
MLVHFSLFPAFPSFGRIPLLALRASDLLLGRFWFSAIRLSSCRISLACASGYYCAPRSLSLTVFIRGSCRGVRVPFSSNRIPIFANLDAWPANTHL